jgi:Cu-Zn family superoxide dismutase
MTRRLRIALAGTAFALAALAAGPPLVSAVVTSTLFTTSTLEERADVENDGIRLKTGAPVDVTVQEVRFAPGDVVDWHDHPGFALIAVKSGSMTFYLGCEPAVRGPGQAIVETGGPTKAVNEGTTEAVFYVTYVVPEGSPRTVPTSPPRCNGHDDRDHEDDAHDDHGDHGDRDHGHGVDHSNHGRHAHAASARLIDAAGNPVGRVWMHERRDGAVDLVARARNLPPGFHGFHVHTTGRCDPPGFTTAGGHYNPVGAPHGSHAGDLPSLLVRADGRATLATTTDRFAIADLRDEDGSAVIVHSGPDNFANIPSRYGGPDAETLSTGDSGARLACGLVR